MKNNDRNNRSELEWAAFRYVSGELDEREAAEFESRLEDDQAAREAVAAAVELVQTVVAAEHLVELPVVATVAREAGMWRRVAWLGIAGAVAACCACLLLMLSSAGRGGHLVEHAKKASTVPAASPAEPLAPLGASAPRGLAAAWLEALDHEIAIESVASSQDSAELETALTGEALLVNSDAGVVAPDWMVSALTGMSDVARERSNAEWEN